jgi:beta-glucanase (GH16 family)
LEKFRLKIAQHDHKLVASHKIISMMSCHKTLIAFLLFFSYFTIISCKKSSSAPSPAGVAPTNLVVNADISTDGTGKVSFTATADNAVSYVYEFGDGNAATVPTGITQYTYTMAGTNNFTVKVTAVSSSNLYASKSISITVTHVLVVVWSDEFDTDGPPDPTKWGYDLGNGSNGWGNNESEYYTNRTDNAVVIGGSLKITAIKENYMGSNYTSARLLTQNKFSFKYGKVEVRAKLPAGVGTWPAIWMLGSDIATAGWPNCGEIDIMEHLGRDLNKIYGTLHYPGHSGSNADGGTKLISNATSEFHIYSLEWSEGAIAIYVDGQLVHSVTNSSSIPFNHDFFLIMNIAMGGGFGGAIDPAFTNASMEIDYVRVYQ